MAGLLRFPDLKQYGVNNWPTLTRWIEREGFPAGFYLAANTRAWHKDEVDTWLANRPKADPPPENVKGDGPASTGTAARKPKPPSSLTNIGESAPAAQASSNGGA
jgi:predicted DNA-binding transcriptional regulator AlpA